MTAKEFFNQFSKILKHMFRSGVILAVSSVLCMVVVFALIWSGALTLSNISSCLAFFFAVLAAFILGVSFITLSVVVSLFKFNYKAKQSNQGGFTNTVLEVKNSEKRIIETVQNTGMAKYILQGAQISQLEKDSKPGTKIIVLTSKYILDSQDFINIILDNIRKDVTYWYLVPNEVESTAAFTVVCKTWWDLFWKAIEQWEEKLRGAKGNQQDVRDEILKTNACFSSAYNQIVTNVLNGVDMNDIRQEAKEYFNNHVEEYLINQEHSLATFILYQRESGVVMTKTPWDVIMKLPTETKDKKYYAFMIPDEEGEEKKHLIERVLKMIGAGKKNPLNI